MKKKGKASQIDNAIGKNIRLLRKKKKMTQTDLAEALGVTFQQVQKYEKGINRIAASTLIDLEYALETSMDIIFKGVPRYTQINH